LQEPRAELIQTVLAIDPGTAKCGIAIVRRPATIPPRRLEHVLCHEVVETERLVVRVLSLLSDHKEVEVVLIGNATRGAVLRRALVAALPAEIPVKPVEEAYTSQRARVRFQIENPPRGWQRLVPMGLRSLPLAYDDYVAILLAEDYFAAGDSSG
jgi:RNase H-fold protein (predicted Holliday junction resolvase)